MQTKTVIAFLYAEKAIEEARTQAAVTTHHWDTLMTRIQSSSSIVSRTVIEHGDGNVSYIQPVPKSLSLDPISIHLTAREQIHCAWLRWKAAESRRAVAEANSAGIYGTQSLHTYQAQADEYEARIGQIEANAAARDDRHRVSFYKQCVVGMAIVLLIALGFALWGA